MVPSIGDNRAGFMIDTGLMVTHDMIRVGSRVQVKDGPDVDTYVITEPDEADPSAGLISSDSPMGRALLGHRAGDRLDISVRPDKRPVLVVRLLT